MSPVEGVHHLGARLILAVSWSQARRFVAAVLAGPLYGVLGQRWRLRRSRLSALLAVSPLLFEPVSRHLQLEWDQRHAYVAEVAAGVLAAVYFAAAVSRSSWQAA